MDNSPSSGPSEHVNQYNVNRKRGNPEGTEELRNAVEEIGPDFMNDPNVSLANKVQRLIHMQRNAEQSGTPPSHNVPTTTGSVNNPSQQFLIFQCLLNNQLDQMVKNAQTAMNQQVGLNFSLPAELQLKSMVPPVNPIMHVKIGDNANPESIDLNPFGAAPSSSGAAHTSGCCDCVLYSVPQPRPNDIKINIKNLLEILQKVFRLVPETLQASHFERIGKDIATAIETIQPEKEMDFDDFEGELLDTLLEDLKSCERNPPTDGILFPSEFLLEVYATFFLTTGSPRLNKTVALFANLATITEKKNIKVSISKLTEIYDSLLDFFTGYD